MKKLALCLALGMTLAQAAYFPASAADTSAQLYGDVNLDNTVNLTDAVLLSKAASGLVDLNDSAKANADVNADGYVDADDALVLLKFQVGLVTKLPDTTTTIPSETTFSYTFAIDTWWDCSEPEDSAEAVVTTSEALSAYLLQFIDETDELYTTYLMTYDDDFFAENTLLLNLCYCSHTGITYEIDDVTPEDEQITIDYHFREESGGDAISYAFMQVIIPSDAYAGETIVWNNTTTATSEFTYEVTVDNMVDITEEDTFGTAYDMLDQGIFPNLYTDTEEGNVTYITSTEELEAFFTTYEDEISLTYDFLMRTDILPYYQEIYDEDFFAEHDLVLRGVSRMDSWDITDVSWEIPTLTISSDFFYMDCVEAPYLYQIVLPKLYLEEITIDWNTTSETTELPNYSTWVDVGFEPSANEAVVTSVEELEAYLDVCLENYTDLSDRYDEDFFAEYVLFLKSSTMVYGDDMVYTIDDVNANYGPFSDTLTINYHYTASTFDGPGDCLNALMQVAVPKSYAACDVVWECTTPEVEDLSFTYAIDDLTNALGEELALDFMNTEFSPSISDETAGENAAIITSRAALEEYLVLENEALDYSEYDNYNSYDDAFFAENTLVLCSLTMSENFAVYQVRSNGSLLQIDTVISDAEDTASAPYLVQVVIPQTGLEEATLCWTITDFTNFMLDDDNPEVFTYTAPEAFASSSMVKTLTIEAYSVLLDGHANIYWSVNNRIVGNETTIGTDDGYNPFSEEGEWSEDEDGNPVYGNGTSYAITWTESGVVIDYLFANNSDIWQTVTLDYVYYAE